MDWMRGWSGSGRLAVSSCFSLARQPAYIALFNVGVRAGVHCIFLLLRLRRGENIETYHDTMAFLEYLFSGKDIDDVENNISLLDKYLNESKS